MIFDEVTNVTLVPVISADPVRVSFTVAPAWKLVPARFVMQTFFVFTPSEGLMELMVGAGSMTLKAPVNVPYFKSVFVTLAV